MGYQRAHCLCLSTQECRSCPVRAGNEPRTPQLNSTGLTQPHVPREMEPSCAVFLLTFRGTPSQAKCSTLSFQSDSLHSSQQGPEGRINPGHRTAFPLRGELTTKIIITYPVFLCCISFHTDLQQVMLHSLLCTSSTQEMQRKLLEWSSGKARLIFAPGLLLVTPPALC